MTKEIIFRATAAESADLKFKAELCNLSFAQYARMVLFENRTPRSALPPEYYQMRKELTAVLNNLTQLSKVANANDLPLADRAHRNAENVRGRIFRIKYELE